MVTMRISLDIEASRFPSTCPLPPFDLSSMCNSRKRFARIQMSALKKTTSQISNQSPAGGPLENRWRDCRQRDRAAGEDPRPQQLHNAQGGLRRLS